MTEGVQVGRIYEGRVTSIKDFGAFVEILPGKDGLVHISELSEGYVGSVTDICRVGDPMLVKAIAVDDQDRVKLSRKAALAERGEVDAYAQAHPAGRAAPAGGGDRGGDRGGPPRRRRPAAAAATAATAAAAAAATATDPRPVDRVRSARARSPTSARAGREPVALDRSGRVAVATIRRTDLGPRLPPRSPYRRTSPMAELIASTARPPDGRRDGRPELDEHEINRRLRAQYAEIAQLAGGLAHEIRNPLSTMRLNLDLLAEDFQEPETPRDRRVLQKIERLRTRDRSGSRTSSRTSSGSPASRTSGSSRPT